MKSGPPGPGTGPRRALQRDRPETPFSRILEAFFAEHAQVVAASFVDSEGECIDYASTIDPYEAKVFGAALLGTTRELSEWSERSGTGKALLWVLETQRYEFVVRRLTEEHMLVLALEPGTLDAGLLRGIVPLVAALRGEAGLDAPSWDPVGGEPFVVETREARGWGYAPYALYDEGHDRRVLDVLGRWVERNAISDQELVCFRVRCADEELTLVHDLGRDRWYRR